jgi:hypothetical protein
MIALFREVVLRVFSRRAPAEILQITENESLAAQVARESTGRGRLELRHSSHNPDAAACPVRGTNAPFLRVRDISEGYLIKRRPRIAGRRGRDFSSFGYVMP